MSLNFLWQKKEEIFSVLDIGTSSVKVLINKKKEKKTVVLGSGVQYFNKENIFEEGLENDFFCEIVKETILRTFKESEEEIFLDSQKKGNKTINYNKWKEKPCLVTLPPNILKARIIEGFLEKPDSDSKISKKEEKVILEKIIRQCLNKTSWLFFRDIGILPDDISWVSLKILEKKIDGYPVNKFEGYKGKELSIEVLVNFLPKRYFQIIKKILQSLDLKVLGIFHLADSFVSFFKEEKLNGVFIDVGGEISQIFMIKEGRLVNVKEWRTGGQDFIRELFQTFAIGQEFARKIQEEYSMGKLNPESKNKIKEIFLKVKDNWFKGLEKEAKEVIFNKHLFSQAFLFGGASLLPEIRESFERVKIFCPKDFKNVEISEKKYNKPQFSPPLFISQIYGA